MEKSHFNLPATVCDSGDAQRTFLLRFAYLLMPFRPHEADRKLPGHKAFGVSLMKRFSF
jgi:hypothetical protein